MTQVEPSFEWMWIPALPASAAKLPVMRVQPAPTLGGVKEKLLPPTEGFFTAMVPVPAVMVLTQNDVRTVSVPAKPVTLWKKSLPLPANVTSSAVALPSGAVPAFELTAQVPRFVQAALARSAEWSMRFVRACSSRSVRAPPW
jgi:hypothetical protein